MKKNRLVKQIIEEIQKDLNNLASAANATREGAIHEESRPEGSKDTRSTEASYLARGQAKRVEQLEETLKRIRFMPLLSFDEETPIAVSALVTLTGETNTKRLFLVTPGAGGIQISDGDEEITTITLESPLGKELAGKQLDDDFDFLLKGAVQEFSITKVE